MKQATEKGINLDEVSVGFYFNKFLHRYFFQSLVIVANETQMFAVLCEV